MMSNKVTKEVKEFLEASDTKIDTEPYSGNSNTIRIRIDDMVLLVHDAEVYDIDEYISLAKEVRKDKQKRRIEVRHQRVKRFLEGPQDPPNNNAHDDNVDALKFALDAAKNAPSPVLCGVTNCNNAATHKWSGHPTCDECATPNRKESLQLIRDMNKL